MLNSFKWAEEFAGSNGGVDEVANGKAGGDSVRRVTRESSKIPGWVVETDEELQCVMIAREAVGQKEDA